MYSYVILNIQKSIHRYHIFSTNVFFEETEINNKKSFTVIPGAHEKGCSASALTWFGQSMQQNE